VTPTSPRSPRRARILLLSSCAAGLSGLALLGGTAAPAPVADAAVASSIEPSEPVLHAPVAAAPRVVALHATRSRLLPAKQPAARHVAHKKAVQVARWYRPSSAGIVSPYGMRWGRMHKGIDFGASYGAPIRAIGDGVVVGTGYQSGESGYGQITIIRHANGFYSAYAHQSSMVVHDGDQVTAGEVIGYVGSTGESTGAHLHFEIRTEAHGGQISPEPWLRAHGVDV
jgi:murein DD-endopeptidase MepM/ murein hydrolase activator NlpD